MMMFVVLGVVYQVSTPVPAINYNDLSDIYAGEMPLNVGYNNFTFYSGYTGKSTKDFFSPMLETEGKENINPFALIRSKPFWPSLNLSVNKTLEAYAQGITAS
jgi:hypothetical protein